MSARRSERVNMCGLDVLCENVLITIGVMLLKIVCVGGGSCTHVYVFVIFI